MSTPELAQIEMLARVDDLVDRMTQWSKSPTSWEPLRRSQTVVRRLLERIETLRVRLESPLVVATFGGTGTGKSALVNALVGCECSASGRQRPTTTRPILLAHPQSQLEPIGLPLTEFEIVRVESSLLRDVVLIDCPDPDTAESEIGGSNLAILRQMLPFCDVLIYTATQQKYRSARVGEELAQAASGCRLVFIQTCADLDEDVREDWRKQLAERYHVPELFFVDSLRALREQQSGLRPSGDFRRLQDLLSHELAASHRVQIRRANLVDLVQAALAHCQSHLDAEFLALERLEQALAQQQQSLVALMSKNLEAELLESRQLWERRLLTAVTEGWGSSPFSVVTRLYSSLGNLIAAGGLFRARSSAQMALVGAVQGIRWLDSKRREHEAESRLDRLPLCGLDDVVLRQARLVIAGFARDARLDPQLVEQNRFEGLRGEAARVEDEFLGDAGRRIDTIVRELAAAHSGIAVRGFYEILLGALLAYIIGRPAYNFFYGNPIDDQTLLPADFYIHAIVFFVLWSSLLVMSFTRRLRRGLMRRVGELARELAEVRFSAGLFPQLDAAIADARIERDRLEALIHSTDEIRREIALRPALGAPRTPTPIAKAEAVPA